MASVNKAIIVGHLGGDPEVRSTQSGMSVCNFTVATSEKNKDGAETTEWHRIVCFGKTADNVGKYLTKGSQVYVEGRIQTRKWTDKEGNDRYTTEIVGNQIAFLGGGAAKPKPQAAPMTADDESLPF